MNNTEQKYIPLTKKVKINGKEKIILAQGTEMCHIHNNGSATIKAPLFRTLLELLNTFEDVYLKADNESELIR